MKRQLLRPALLLVCAVLACSTRQVLVARDPGPRDGGANPWHSGFRFTEPVAVVELNSPEADVEPFVAADGLTIYFASDRPGGAGGLDVYVATRPEVTAPWRELKRLDGMVNTPAWETRYAISSEGLTAYLSTARPGGLGESDIWFATRSGPAAPFSTFVPLPAVNSPYNDYDPFPTADGLRLYLNVEHPRWAPADPGDVALAQRKSVTEPFSAPQTVPGVNLSASNDGNPALTGDELVLVFTTLRNGDSDIFYSVRNSPSEPFSTPQGVPDINGPASTIDKEPFVTSDGRHLYFSSDRAGGRGGLDLYVAHLVPQ